MSNLVVDLSIFYFLIFIGFISGIVFKKYNERIRKALTFVLIYILTPILIFLAFFISNVTFGVSDVINIVVYRLILLFISQFFLYFIFLRKRGVEHNPRKGTMLSMVGFPNTGLFPMPIVLAFFGSEFIPILIIFSITALTLRGTWLTWLCIRFGKEEGNGVLKTIKQIFSFPPTIALIICVILLSLNVEFDQEFLIVVDDIVSSFTSIAGNLLIGVLLVNINFKQIKEYKKDFSIVVFMRVVFSCILFFLVAIFLTFPLEIKSPTFTILLILYVCPPAILSTTFAEYFKLDKEFTAFSVFTMTIMAIFYIPIFLIIGLIIF